MSATKIWGWILLILGILGALRGVTQGFRFSVIMWIITLALLIVGIFLLLKPEKKIKKKR